MGSHRCAEAAPEGCMHLRFVRLGWVHAQTFGLTRQTCDRLSAMLPNGVRLGSRWMGGGCKMSHLG